MSAPPQAPTPTHVPPTTENCRFCWMCRHVCPVGHVTHRETLTPHAWALTIESVRRWQLAWSRETADVMYACADCGLCQAHCVTDQPLPDAIVRARADLVAARFAPPVVYDLDARLQEYRTVYAATRPARANGQHAVALFVGDAAHYLGPRAVDAAVALLAAAGVAATPIARGRSTGLLANTLGLEHTASALARDVLDEIADVRVRDLLVLTPVDDWTFTHVYPVRLGLEWPTAVRVRSALAVLADAHRAGRLRIRAEASGAAIAYHEPCRSVGDEPHESVQAARDLLAAALGSRPLRQLFWREGRAHPCGAVGGLEFTQPTVAAALADRRFADAAAAGAGSIVTEDPVCVYHLSARRPAGIDVRNLYELLAAQCA